MTKEEKQYKKMTEGSTSKLVFTLGLPAMISMLVTAIYNIADTLFVSKIDADGLASAAVTIVFPLMAIIQAIGFTFGMGSGSLISSKLGERKEEDAQRIGSSAFYIAIILGLVITILSLIFINPLLRLLGASSNVLPYAKDYAIYVIIGFPIMAGSFVMNNILRSEGKAKFSMIGLTVGGILNIFLDPLFINTFNMGIKGAAIATVISQGISFLILLSMFVFKKSIIKLAIDKVSKAFDMYLSIVKVGFPSLCRQGLASIATILLNNMASKYGSDQAQAAMGIVSKVVMIIFSMGLGIGQGYQPVCGYNYFAKKYERVREAMKFTFIFALGVMTFVSVICFIFSDSIIRWFNENETIVNIGSKALKYQCISMPFLSVNVIINMTLQSTRKNFMATILSCCRQGLFFIPIILLLPLIIEIDGVVLTQPISDVCTCLFSIPFYFIFFKILKKKEEELKLEVNNN